MPAPVDEAAVQRGRIQYAEMDLAFARAEGTAAAEGRPITLADYLAELARIRHQAEAR